MVSSPELVAKYSLTDMEKKLFLHADLLKIMMGQQQGAEQFGNCLAEMCKDDFKLSQKVSKVFIKAFNTSNSDNLRAYL